MKNYRALITLALSTFIYMNAAQTASAQSYGYDYGRSSDLSSKDEGQHILSIGGGISSPSEATVFGENPAGLIYNRSPKLLFSLSTHPEDEHLMGTSGYFFTGNGLAAASLGVRSYSNSADQKGSISYFDFGLSTYSEGLNTSIGISGTYRFQKPGYLPPAIEQDTWTANIGLLFNPFGAFRIGVNLYDVAHSITSYGLGLSAEVNQFATLSIDGSINSSGEGMTVKPAIGVLAGSLQVSYGYGMKTHDSNHTSAISAGNTLGLGFQATEKFQLQFQYNHVALYFLGATVRF